ncbi:hypothetical protein KR032_006993, partial [Drosophila birchii]
FIKFDLMKILLGVLALVFAVSMSAEVAEQDNDVISDRRYRWDSSEQDLDDLDALDDDSDAQDDDDQSRDDDDQDHSDEFEEIEIWELAPESEETSRSEESGSNEA